MKIVQLVTTLHTGDAIGEEVLRIHAYLQKHYDAHIVAVQVQPALKHLTDTVDLCAMETDDLVILHKASGDDWGSVFACLRCKKVLLYHNITPPSFFVPYDLIRAWNQWRGRRQLKTLVREADWAWGDSRYNCDELVSLGFDPIKTAVLPICLPFEHERPKANTELAETLRAQKQTKILYVGRIAPNKKYEDILKAFFCYQTTVDPSTQLYLVGSWQGYEKYYAKLMGFAADLKLQNVVFTGQVSQEDKWAYYSSADLMLCMSEHEGFCVPLLEAMYYQIPVLAYATTAVTETLGDAGQLFAKKDYAMAAAMMHRLITDTGYRQEVLERQNQRLQQFLPSRFEETIAQRLCEVMEDRQYG